MFSEGFTWAAQWLLLASGVTAAVLAAFIAWGAALELLAFLWRTCRAMAIPNRIVNLWLSSRGYLTGLRTRTNSQQPEEPTNEP